MTDWILRMRSRPLHIRRRVTIMASSAATAVVATAWLVAGITLGTFSFSSPQQSTAVAALGDSISHASSQTASAFAGVTSIGSEATGTSSGGLTILETKKSSTIAQVDTSNQTIIPF